MGKKPKKSLDEVVRRDGRYSLDAFPFLQEGLKRAVKQAYGEKADEDRPHHVTGRQLCLALRDEALERWGILARNVLTKWNIHATVDFGNMVYLLVDNALMDKTEEDCLDHFRDVYDFATAFEPGDLLDSEE